MNESSVFNWINEYTVTWCIYLLACAGVFLVFWHISSRLPAVLRQVLRLALVCIILTPAVVEPGQEQELLAPAFIVAAFEAATGSSDGAVRATTALVLTLGSVLLLYSIWLLGRYLYRKRIAPATQRELAARQAPAPTKAPLQQTTA